MSVREDILARMFVTMGTVAGLSNVYRNKINVPDASRPAAVLLAGDEASDEDLDDGRPLTKPHRMVATPEIYILIGGAGVTTPGSDLNALRVLMLDALLSDATLAALSLNGCGVSYEGCATTFQRGRTVAAEMGLSISVAFLMRPV